MNFSPFESHLYERLLEVFRIKRQHCLKDKEKIPRLNGDPELETYVPKERRNGIDEYFEFYDKNLRLDEMDRKLIDKVLLPLLDLRLSCDHPQLVLTKKSFVGGAAAPDKDKLYSMEKSLNIMLKKTRDEAEVILREVKK